MTEWKEWDIDNPAHRRPRIEVMEPQEPPRYHRVEITVGHHRRAPPPRFLPIFVAIVALLLLCRYPLGFLMLAALAGWQVVSMFLFVFAPRAVRLAKSSTWSSVLKDSLRR
jgi:hypothetical protein